MARSKNFASDNTVGASKKIIEAMIAANTGAVPAYGNDDLTKALEQKCCEIFNKNCFVFPVATGTAANAVALSAITPPWGMILCHKESHIVVDECNAPLFFSGGASFQLFDGQQGKLTCTEIENFLKLGWQGEVHRSQPASLSITNVSERGEVYSQEELLRLNKLAHSYHLKTHLDGARIANALVELNQSPADLTWKAGFDLVSLGATKNGTFSAEAILCFDESIAETIPYIRKKSGHLFSKMRLLSAQLLAYFEDDLWLANASHANKMMAELMHGLRPYCNVLGSPKGNVAFVEISKKADIQLQADGFQYYEMPYISSTCKRLVTSWASDIEDVKQFIKIVAEN